MRILSTIKSLFLLMTMFFVISCSSNPIKPSEGIDQAFSAEGSKAALVKKSLAWAEKRRVTPQSLVKVSYQDDARIIGTGMTTVVNSLETKNVYRFVMQINLKDNQAQIVLNDINQVEGYLDESLTETLKVIKQNLQDIAESYEKALTEVVPSLEN